jgi:hypothetical protein
MSSSNILVNIIGEFQKKGFDDANKATGKLDANFKKLAKTAAKAFVAVAGLKALKASVKAFAEEDAAVKRLTKSLDNLGLRFQSGGIDEYLDNLEKVTTVTKDQLYPAFQQLANTTLDVGKSQNLLNAALDISAGTGKDLSSVVTALSRAFNGNFASLGKLQTSYTTAELEAMGFEKSLQALAMQFTGSAAASADTYEGKIKKLNIAFEDASEAIGEGVIDALEALGSGNYDKGLENIVTIGEKIGDAFRGAARFASITRLILGSFSMSSKEFEAAALALNSAFAGEDPARQRTYMRDRAKNLAKEQAETNKLRVAREKAAKAVEKERKEQDKLNKLRSKFNLEKIQIAAALQGRISQEEVVRLKLMQALENENVTLAEKYAKQLKEIQENQKLLADTQLTLSASNPFAKLNTDAETGVNKVKELQKSIETLTKDEAKVTIKLNTDELMSGVNRVNAALQMYQAQVVNALSPIYTDPLFKTNVVEGLNITEKQLIDKYFAEGRTDKLKNPIRPGVDLNAVIESIRERDRIYERAQQQYRNIIPTPELGAATEDLFKMLGTTTTEAMNTGSVVNVVVQGNVTTEQDLAQTIIEQQYEYQRSGGKLTYNTVAL